MTNKTPDLGSLPIGLVVMRYAYVSVALIYAFAAVLLSPYVKVSYCGLELGHFPSVLINSVLILLPLILYFGFSRPTIIIWYLSFLYHLFFIGNSFLGMLSLLFPKSAIVPLLEISGKSALGSSAPTDPLPSLAMQMFSAFNIIMLCGIFVLWYLWQKKEHFMPESLLKNI